MGCDRGTAAAGESGSSRRRRRQAAAAATHLQANAAIPASHDCVQRLKAHYCLRG